MDHSVWHYRCELVHSKGTGTMEQRLRSLATEWLHNLQTNPDLPPFKSRHLINRSARYFQSGDVRAINAWVRRIDAEMKNAKVTAHAGDIRRWLVPNSNSKSLYQLSPQHSQSESDESEICDTSNASMDAIHDIYIEDDSITTFPFSKNTCQTCESNPPPHEIVCSTVDQKSNSEVYQDRYEMIKYKKKKYIRIVDEDSDTDDSSVICTNAG